MRLKKQTAKYVLEIQLPKGMSPETMRLYIEDAFRSYKFTEVSDNSAIRFVESTDLIDSSTLKVSLLQLIKDY